MLRRPTKLNPINPKLHPFELWNSEGFQARFSNAACAAASVIEREREKEGHFIMSNGLMYLNHRSCLNLLHRFIPSWEDK